MKVSRRRVMQVTAMTIAAPLCMPHVARAATKRLRIGHNNSTSSSLQVASLDFAKYVGEKTDGRYEVDVYPNAQLGGDSQIIRAVAEGTLDMTICATAILGTYASDMELVELPYLFKDLQSARAAMAGNLGAYYVEQLKGSSIAVIGWGENGFRHITANKPIRTVADIKGLKIRVQPAKIQVASFTGLGAAAAPLNFNELAEALRTGKFEAQENPIGIAVASDFIIKSQSHLSLTSHVYSPFAVVFSADVLEDMPEADRAIIRAGGAVAAKSTMDFNERAVAVGLDTLKAAGMTIVADVNRSDFEAAMAGLGDRLAAVAGADAIARVRSLIV